jgi:hypothetical protein
MYCQHVCVECTAERMEECIANLFISSETMEGYTHMYCQYILSEKTDKMS